MPKEKNKNSSRRNHNPTKRKLNAKKKGIKKHYTQTKTQIRGNEIPKKMNPNVKEDDLKSIMKNYKCPRRGIKSLRENQNTKTQPRGN